MTLRSGKEYLASLSDNRVVFYAGQRIASVTSHPELSLHANAIANSFGNGMGDDEATLKQRSTLLPDGDRVHRWAVAPRSREDLLAFVEMEENLSGDEHGALTAGLSALQILAPRMDAKHGTNYVERITKYADWFARTDVQGAFAMTDAKGDRSKAPSGQVDPDLFLRVVERRKDGIVIRGAKTSVTAAALANELLVLPTHAMGEADKDWAVACAVPANAPGVVMISNYVGKPWGPEFKFDRPLNHSAFHHDATVFFDNVFVPHEKVFMDGEFEFTREFLGYFTSLHRTRILVMEPRDTKKLIGVAQLMARYNGLEKVGGIKDRIGEMIQTAVLLDTLRYAAFSRLQFIEGICVPDAAACNLAGLTVTSTRQGYLSFLCELAGGPVLTAPTGMDLANPETEALVRKYYVGSPGVGAEERLRLVKYIYDIAASDSAGWDRALAVSGAGSPGARRVAAARGFDVEACAASVLADLNASNN